MIRGLRSALLIIIALQGLSAGASCTTCTPTQKTGWTLNAFTVRYSTTGFSASDKQAIADAMASWNNAYGGLFTLTTSSTADILLEVDVNLMGTSVGAERATTAANVGGVIRFNPDYLGSSGTANFVRHVAAHEFGHAQGFSDLSNCASDSIMNGAISTSGPFLSGLSSCDTTAVSNATPPNTGGGGGGSGGDEDNQCDAEGCSPIVLDLNGDGIHTTSGEWPVLFDIDGDGDNELLAWTNPATDEGFLWIDSDANGRVDGGRELFGIGTILPDGRRAIDGVDALSAFDLPENGGNNDGVITREDAIWARLRVWIDFDHSGSSQPRETGPIHEYGVTTLHLSFAIDRTPDANGNIHQYRGKYSRRVVGSGPAHEGDAAMHDVFFREVPR